MPHAPPSPSTLAAIAAYRPHGAARVGAWLLVLLACAAGFAVNRYSNPQLDFGAAFLVPIVAGAWYLGRGPGLAIVALGAIAWFTASGLQPGVLEPWALAANTLSRFSVFLVIALLVSALRELLARMDQLSRTDALTGLANARELGARGEHDLDVAARAGLPTSLVYLDLDNFKAVNDGFGHAAGDELLREVGRILKGVIRKSDHAARLGGDEFALLLVGTPGAAARELASEAHDAIEAACRKKRYPVSVSLGLATAEAGEGTFEELVESADRAMYAAKDAGKNRIAEAPARPPGPKPRAPARA